MNAALSDPKVSTTLARARMVLGEYRPLKELVSTGQSYLSPSQPGRTPALLQSIRCSELALMAQDDAPAEGEVKRPGPGGVSPAW